MPTDLFLKGQNRTQMFHLPHGVVPRQASPSEKKISNRSEGT